MSTPINPFFGLTTASAEFLRQHGVYYTRTDGNLDVFVEKSSTGRVLVYLLYHPGQLRVASLAELQRTYPSVTAEAAGLNKLPVEKLYDDIHSVGQLVYRNHFEDPENRSSLLHSAYDAARNRGVTRATAQWFGQYLVQDAFGGLGTDQQFTAEGVRYGANNFASTEATVRRQLGLLQTAGALTFTRDKADPGFFVRYNKEYLPDLAHELAPQFFTALCY